MINIVHAVLAVANIDQHLHHGDDVLGRQHAFAGDLPAPDPAVELHAPDRGQIIALRAEEQILEQIFGRVTGGRLAGPHHAVDLDLRLQLAGGRIIAQGIGDVGAMVEVIGINGVEFQRLARADFFQQFFSQLGIGRKFDLAGFGVEDVSGKHLAQQEFDRNRQGAKARLFHFANMTRIDALLALDNHLALVILNIKRRHLAAQAISDPCQTELPGLDLEGVLVKKQFQHLGGGITQGAQQDGRMDLAAPVNAAVQQVFGIEFQVQPRAAIGDDPGRIQQLARGMGLAFVMLKEYAGRAVHLRDDHALGAVDDKGARAGHERHFAHIDLLFPDILDFLFIGLALLVIDHQACLDPQ